MRFSARPGLAKFFHNSGFIELEGLLTEKEVALLSASIDKTLSLRLGMPTPHLLELSPTDLYKAGHDLCRVDPDIKKIVWSKRLAEIVFEITNERPLRFAFDQAFRVGSLSASSPVAGEPPTLNSIAGLQGKLYGLMLTLKGGQENSSIFSSHPGHGTLFASTLPLDLSPLYACPDQSYLLIVFTGLTSVVLFKNDMPHPFAFKQLGYGAGDLLHDEFNPILLR